MNARADRMAEKLQTLAQSGRQTFGAEWHRFRTKPPLSEQEVVAFEGRHEIELPSEYRTFLLRVADGGAGPAYGMYSLESAIGGSPIDFLRTPFPYAESFNPYHDPEERSLWERVERGEVSEDEADRLSKHQTTGTLQLCHEGCAYYHFLVVMGAARGMMWIDGAASDWGYVSLGIGFFDWYERWLDDALAGGDGVWWLRRSTK